MEEGIKVHESGVGLTKEQKIDVEDIFLGVWQNKIKPEMKNLVKDTTNKSCQECKRIDDIDYWFGKVNILGREVYLIPIIFLFLCIVEVVNLLI